MKALDSNYNVFRIANKKCLLYMYDDVYVFMYGVNSLYVKSNRYFFMFISIFISRVLKFLCTLLSCGQENSSFAYTVRRTRHQNFAKRGLTEEKIVMNFLSHCLSPNVKVNMAYYFKSSFLLCDILTTSLLRFLSRFYELSWKNVYIMLYCPSKVFGFLWDMERKSWMNDFFFWFDSSKYWCHILLSFLALILGICMNYHQVTRQ